LITLSWIKERDWSAFIIISTIMQDNIQAMREWFQIAEIEFGFLHPEEIRRISVTEIDKYKVYDEEKKPVKGGLYDPLLGVSPNDRDSICPTCGHKGLECSGHPGHI
jgi:DNA-directed RNA polymerase beta' subunit